MKKILVAIALMAILPLAAGAQLFDSSTAKTKAQTKYGQVAGYIERGVYTYKGIPYAQAERFQPAHEPKAWQGVRSCRHWGPVCPQTKNNGWRGDQSAFFYQWNDGYQSEDCQRLNIWTKGLNDGKKRPVLFWLHGGGYTSGNGQEHPGYDGRNLAEKGDVVVVTINHRLNVLGFLDLSAFGEKYKGSANLGMTDIVAALRWVKENIANFGGDPDCVTIFGQSGGGGKVSTLLCMPSAKGLFHRAMVMSGSFHACHNSDIPFFFNNVVKSAQMTGATKEGIALGDKMSSALLNFARTGNPNAKGLPQWPAFTPETQATMRFDAPKCQIMSNR